MSHRTAAKLYPNGRINLSIEAYRLLGEPDELEILIDLKGRLGFRPPVPSSKYIRRVNKCTPSVATVNCARALSILDARYYPQSFNATYLNGVLIVDVRCAKRDKSTEIAAL